MLKRSGFKRPAYERPPREVLVAGPAFRYGAPAEARAAEPKREYVRSEAMMAAYRMIPCVGCGSLREVFGAHSNWAIHGKGGHIKADDNRCASLCSRDCHRTLDQGSHWSELQRKTMWWHWHTITVSKLVMLGLWPADAPVPDLSPEFMP